MKFSTQQSDLIQYNGLSCEILRELNSTECDIEEVGVMYKILLSNGIEIDAFSDELQ